MDDGLLVFNAGSSSLKFALYAYTDSDDQPQLMLRGQIAGIGAGPVFSEWNRRGESPVADEYPDLSLVGSHDDAISKVLEWIQKKAVGINLIGVGHRVVHGGGKRRSPALVTPQLMQELGSLCLLAPHHQPHNLAAIRAVAAEYPALPQVACFDTAFHADQPEVARRLPLPRRYRKRGVIRYGFHGLSYEFIAGAVPAYNGGAVPRRLIVAHLGNGASLCAIEDGVAKATTMGFSTLDGVMMGTRSGSIDPGVLLHLMREEGMGEAQLTELVYNQCGLLGVSGISQDMRELLASSDPRAAEAVELYCYTLIQALGSLIGVMEGLDGIVFTGGIGEHAAEIRTSLCSKLQWIGLLLDEPANAANGSLITQPDSRVKAWVIPTDEELVIARHTGRLIQGMRSSNNPVSAT